MAEQGGIVSHAGDLRSLRQHYGATLDKLADRLGERLWITGGWARAGILKQKYAGDIDCLVLASAREIDEFARDAGFERGVAPLGDPRLILPDRNQIDFIVVDGPPAPSSVLAALQRFNFSVNSIAINYVTGAVVRTADNLQDVGTSSLRVNEQFDYRSSDLMLARNFEIFEKYHRLRPVDTPPTRAARALVDDFNRREAFAAPDDVLRQRAEQVRPHLPAGARAWIVRGSVRCALLSETKYWDDIDVVIDRPLEDLVRHLSAAKSRFSPNYFGTPKVVLANGLKADIWSLRDGDGIEAELGRYAHNLDAIGWSIDDRQVCDPLGTMTALDKRFLDVNLTYLSTASEHDVQHAALKSLYLIVRHKLAFSPEVARLLNRGINPTPFLIRQLIRLLQELCLVVERSELRRSFESLDGAQGSNLVALSLAHLEADANSA